LSEEKTANEGGAALVRKRPDDRGACKALNEIPPAHATTPLRSKTTPVR